MIINPVHRRLKEARKKKKLTQKKLGMSINIDESSAGSRINHYEKNRHAPDFETLDAFAKILDVPVPFFYCQDEVMAELICEIGELTIEQQKKLLICLKQKNYPL